MTVISPGSTSVTVQVQVVNDSGHPVTGLDHTTFPTTYYLRSREAPVAITLASLAAQTSAWTSGGVKELNNGYYRLDVPNAAFATEADVKIEGEASNKRLICPTIQCKDLKTGSFASAAIAQLSGLGITYSAPTLQNAVISPPIIRGRDYSATDNRAIDIVIEDDVDFTGASCYLTAKSQNTGSGGAKGAQFKWTGSIVNPGTSEQTLRFEPTDDETTQPEANYEAQAVVVLASGRKISPAGIFTLPLVGEDDVT